MNPESPREEALVLAAHLRRMLAAQPDRFISTWRLPLASDPETAPAAPMRPPEPEILPSGGPRTPEGESPAGRLKKLLLDEIGDCHRCPLGDTRKKLVFGVGNPQALVMFIGEGPGFMEDRLGEPFVGPAGQLLDKILASIDLSRSESGPSWKWVYIANVVKCHPMVDARDPEKRGNDRPPAPEESAKCLPFLQKQIAVINPRFIVTLGATATKVMLATEQGISKIRGRWHEYGSIKVLPTYHPAALLRNPALKKDVWEDMKRLRSEMRALAS